MADEKNLDELRAKARAAMEGPERQVKEETESKEIAAKRHAAFLAMEGTERRIKREQKEKELHDKQEMLRRIDEEVKKRESEATAKKAAAEAARKQEQELKEEEIKRKEDEYLASQKEIEQLKQQRGTTLRVIRTLKSDLNDAIKQEQLSAAKIAIAEQQRQPAIENVLGEDGQGSSGGRGKILSLIVILLFIGVAVWGGYWYYTKQPETASQTALAVTPIITADNNQEIDTTKIAADQLPTAISELRQVAAGNGEQITDLYFTLTSTSSDQTNKVVNTKKILDFTAWQTYSQTSIPEDFARFVSDYMIAIFRSNTSSSTDGTMFFVLAADPYESVYQTLLDNENGWVRDIFKSLDGNDIAAATTDQQFSDYLLKNLNTRVLRDDQGQTRLIYTFLDRKTLIFAESEDALYRAYLSYHTNVQ